MTLIIATSMMYRTWKLIEILLEKNQDIFGGNYYRHPDGTFLLKIRSEETLNTWKINKFYGPFLWMGFPHLKTAKLLIGHTFLLTSKFIGFPGTDLIGLGWIKGWVNHYAMAPNSYIAHQNMVSVMT